MWLLSSPLLSNYQEDSGSGAKCQQALPKYLGPVRHAGGLEVLSCAGTLVAMANRPAGAMIHLHGKERALWRRQYLQKVNSEHESPDAGIGPKRQFRAKH